MQTFNTALRVSSAGIGIGIGIDIGVVRAGTGRESRRMLHYLCNQSNAKAQASVFASAVVFKRCRSHLTTCTSERRFSTAYVFHSNPPPTKAETTLNEHIVNGNYYTFDKAMQHEGPLVVLSLAGMS